MTPDAAPDSGPGFDLGPFARCVQRDEPDLDLAEASLLIARSEYPALDVAHYVSRLDAFAGEVRAALPGPAGRLETVKALNGFLFSKLGFAGNTENYYDPRNSFLNDVIDRRRGIPITLAVVYIEVGRRLGLPLAGVSFPGHFLVRMADRGGIVVLDPFFRGISLSKEDLLGRVKEATGVPSPSEDQLAQLLAAASKKDMLLRMLRNLKGIYVQARQWDKALVVANMGLVVAPEAPTEVRDRGLIHERLDCFRAAAADYERYLGMIESSEDETEVRRHLQAMKHASARLN